MIIKSYDTSLLILVYILKLQDKKSLKCSEQKQTEHFNDFLSLASVDVQRKFDNNSMAIGELYLLRKLGWYNQKLQIFILNFCFKCRLYLLLSFCTYVCITNSLHNRKMPNFMWNI